MSALASLPRAVRGLGRNPVLVAIVGVFAAIQLPQILFPPTNPFVAAIVSLVLTGVMVVLVPFFQGGILQMGTEAIDGRTSLSSFLAAGRDNYVRLFLGYLAILAINVGLGMLLFGAIFLVGVGAFAAAGMDPTTLVLVGLLGLFVVAVYLLVAFFLQFYGHAIVLDDERVIDGFRRSVRLVRSHLWSTLGYSLIVGVGSMLFGGLGGALSIVLSPQSTNPPLAVDLGTPLVVGAAALYVLILAIAGAFYATYSVSFYRSIRGNERS